MQIAVKGNEDDGTKSKEVVNPTPRPRKNEVDMADAAQVPNPDVKTSREVVASGDYEKPVPVGLDPVFTNPEYNKAADQLFEAVRHQLVFVWGEEYNRKKTLDIANKILESRVQ